MKRLRAPVLAVAVLALCAASAPASDGHRHGRHERGDGRHDRGRPTALDRIKHIVVVYEENHSFDNLYGGWEGVTGLAAADAAHTAQVDQAGAPVQVPAAERRQPHVAAARHEPARTDRRTTPSRATSRTRRSRSTTSSRRPTRRARRRACSRAERRAQGRRACPAAARATSCTASTRSSTSSTAARQNRYVTGSDAVGLTMGVYDTKQLPIYALPARPGAPGLRDRRPLLPGGVRRLVPQPPVAGRRARRRRSGAPRRRPPTCTRWSTQRVADQLPALHADGRASRDGALTVACGTPRPAGARVRRLRGQHDPADLPAVRAGDRARAAAADARRRSATASARRASTGRGTRAAGRTPTATSARPGWTNGSGPTCTDPETPPASARTRTARTSCSSSTTSRSTTSRRSRRARSARAQHLRDEAGVRGARRRLRAALPAQAGELHQADRRRERAPRLRERAHRLRPSRRPAAGHPGRPCAKDTMVVVTYDEFGGQWDHVPPPGQGTATPGPHDEMGPSTRIPALVLAPGLKRGFIGRPRVARHDVDHGDDRAPLRAAAGGRATPASRTCRPCSARRGPARPDRAPAGGPTARGAAVSRRRAAASARSAPRCGGGRTPRTSPRARRPP